ncbi:MAG: divalent-cation tolerance protein CutA [Planctomycetaceae bacterium]|jgi:periplasmic divalent cation tolerance protein|nr:divalent-cation tolerance protein CutA [Planctomycetaceae bacterium]
MSDYIQLQITFPSDESAHKTAAKLVAEKLAACAQVCGTVCSYYTWQGRNEKSTETLLLAKTKLPLFDKLVEFVRCGHPYECPQIVALPIVVCNNDYARWLDEQLG